MKCQVAWTQCTCVGPYKAVLSCQIAKTWGEQTIWNQCHPRQFYQASVFFTVAVKGQYMEDLLGSLLLTTVSQNEPKISQPTSSKTERRLLLKVMNCTVGVLSCLVNHCVITYHSNHCWTLGKSCEMWCKHGVNSTFVLFFVLGSTTKMLSLFKKFRKMLKVR